MRIRLVFKNPSAAKKIASTVFMAQMHFFLFYSGNAESLLFRSKAPLLTCLYFNHSLTQSITIYVFQAKEKDDDDEQDGGGGKESDRKYFFITKLNILWIPVIFIQCSFLGHFLG